MEIHSDADQLKQLHELESLKLSAHDKKKKEELTR